MLETIDGAPARPLPPMGPGLVLRMLRGETAVPTQGAQLDRYLLFCGAVPAAEGAFSLA